MAGFLAHLIVYSAVNGFLVAIWAITTGDTEAFRTVGDGEFEGVSWVREHEFWPIWPMLGWGVALSIHFALVMVTMPRRLRKKHLAFHKWQEALARQKAGVLAPDRDHPDRPSVNVSLFPAPGSSRTTRRKERARQWVAVMLLDVADSTRMNEVLGDDAWTRLLMRIRGLVRERVDERGGAEVGTQGDSLLARFESPEDAVRCAVEVQRELWTRRGDGGIVPQVRIGVHAGEVVSDDGDLVGRVVNLTARVTSAAEPGEIFVTEPVADDVAGAFELEDRGLHSLRGVGQPRHLLSVRWRERDEEAQAANGSRVNGAKAAEPAPGA